MEIVIESSHFSMDQGLVDTLQKRFDLGVLNSSSNQQLKKLWKTGLTEDGVWIYYDEGDECLDENSLEYGEERYIEELASTLKSEEPIFIRVSEVTADYGIFITQYFIADGKATVVSLDDLNRALSEIKLKELI